MYECLISIVLPVYNQEHFIQGVLHRYYDHLKKLPAEYELILVINGCTDNSAEVCRQLADQIPAIRVYEIKEKGWGVSVRHGIKQAKGDLICYTNCARTSGEELLLLLLYALGTTQAVVKATRRVRDHWVRKIGSFVYNMECRLLFGIPTWDVNATPKVFPRSFDQLMTLSRDDDLIDLEFTVICRQNGYPIKEVPIFSVKRHGGKSTMNLSAAGKLLGGAIKMRFAQTRGAQ